MSIACELNTEMTLLSYSDLLAYVNQNSEYAQRHATQLWNTMTAYLPIDDKECFVVQSESGEAVSIDSYKKIYVDRSGERHNPRYINTKKRMGWKVSRRLINRFEERARSLTPGEIMEYGTTSRALMANWLS